MPWVCIVTALERAYRALKNRRKVVTYIATRDKHNREGVGVGYEGTLASVAETICEDRWLSRVEAEFIAASFNGVRQLLAENARLRRMLAKRNRARAA